jgi:hypothetical protein
VTSPTSWINASITWTEGSSTTVGPGSVGSVDVVVDVVGATVVDVVLDVDVVGATVVDVVLDVDVVGATVVDVVLDVDVVGATVVDVVLDVDVVGSATGSGPLDPHANPMHASTATAVEVLSTRILRNLTPPRRFKPPQMRRRPLPQARNPELPRHTTP